MAEEKILFPQVNSDILRAIERYCQQHRAQTENKQHPRFPNKVSCYSIFDQKFFHLYPQDCSILDEARPRIRKRPVNEYESATVQNKEAEEEEASIL